MAKKEFIPIHNFSTDDDSSIAFKLIPLESRTGYDTSVPHRHNYYEIFLFTKGGGKHEIDFNLYEIKNNSVHFVSPGQVHKVKRKPSSHGYIILFSRDFFYSNSVDKNRLFDIPFLNNSVVEPIINMTESEFNQISVLVSNMLAEYKSEQEFQHEAIQSYLNLLLLNAKRMFDKQLSNNEIYNTEFQQFKKLVENGFEKNHNVSNYASLLGITEKQLSIVTKKAVGKTALGIIHERLILEAKRLLRHSTYSIKEIAFFLNFDDPSHFGKFFKNKEGVTPNEFRDKN